MLNYLFLHTQKKTSRITINLCMFDFTFTGSVRHYWTRHNMKIDAMLFSQIHAVILKVPDLNKIKRVTKVFKMPRRLFRLGMQCLWFLFSKSNCFSSEYIFTSYSAWRTNDHIWHLLCTVSLRGSPVLLGTFSFLSFFLIFLIWNQDMRKYQGNTSRTDRYANKR